MLLMGAICLISLGLGLAFWWVGAWPVLGFFGLDLALIYWAFRWNYRAGRQAEVIELSPELLTLTRYHVNGHVDREELNPYWTRVLLKEDRRGTTRLALTSHGRAIDFAGFLSEDERREFAEALRCELDINRGRAGF